MKWRQGPHLFDQMIGVGTSAGNCRCAFPAFDYGPSHRVCTTGKLDGFPTAAQAATASWLIESGDGAAKAY